MNNFGSYCRNGYYPSANAESCHLYNGTIQMNRTVRSPSSQRDLDDTPRKRQSVISPTLLLNITKFVNTETTPEAFDLLRLSYQTDDTL